MTPSRHALLQRLYDIHATVVQEGGLACCKGCAACCTRNVTLTTLEADLIRHYLQTEAPNGAWSQWCRRLAESGDLVRFQPQVTINQIADLCIRDAEIPEEEMDPEAGPCPFLGNDVCRIYPARPFGCRAMISTETCSTGHAALMPEFALTVNNVFLQYIEAADPGGMTGNLIDVLLTLSDDENLDPTDIRRMAAHERRHLIPNHPMSVLMVPPEHRNRMIPVLKDIQDAFKTSETR